MNKSQTISHSFNVAGMHCAACELTIERNVKPLPGVKKADAVLSKKTLNIEIFPGTDINELKLQINSAIGEYGYEIVDEVSNHKNNWKKLATALLFATGIVGLFLLVQKLGIGDLVSADQMNLPVIFMIGVVASLSTCMAVVGGLVLTISSSYTKANKGKTKPLVLFHISRLVGFFVLGGIIGTLGTAFTLSLAAIFIINLILFAVMIILGLNMLDVFPALNKFQLRMPKVFTSNKVNQHEISGAIAPIMLGIITFFLPCGFTQSMQLFSLTTGGFFQGATTMFVFALGTLPVLALISFASAKFSKGLNSDLFFKTAGFLILFFAAFNFLSALAAIGIIPPILLL